MAWYDIEFSCGHTESRQVVGRVKDRESKIDWLAQGLCSECYEAEKQRRFNEENAKAAAEAADMGLPELTGTEKQVSWANTLRQNWIVEAEKWIAYSEGRLDRGRFKNHPEEAEKLKKAIAGMKAAMEARLLTEASARFWIDNRYETVSSFLNEAGEKALQEPETKPAEVPKEVEQGALEEMTLRPSEPVTPLVTEIRIKDDLVTAKLPEKNEDFRLLARGLRFSWQNGRWERKIQEVTGAALDRAAELGIKLLAAGFPVRVYQDELQQQILAGAYEPECDRWIFKYEAGFRIKWFNREEDFYREAKRLPGSRWISEKRSMYAPREAFRELQDFAAQYEFRFTVKAQERLVEAAQAFSAAMVADVSVPEQEPLTQPRERPILSTDQVDGEIDADLRD